jgi:hypothetical protein
MIAIALVLLCAGCKDTPTTTPTTPEQVAPAPSVAVCEPFTLEWGKEVDMSGPHVTIIAGGERWLSEHEIEQLAGEWVPLIGWYFGTRYRVRGKIDGCWSDWFQFEVGSANVDASAAIKVELYVWENESCTDFIFTAGQSETLKVLASREIRVRTFDRFHRKGYQPGQVETLRVEWGGWKSVTQDIPDDKTEQETVFTLSSPLDSVKLTGVSGSVHGACVAGR